MKTTNRPAEAPTQPPIIFDGIFSWPTALVEAALKVQQMQFDSLLAWQKAMADMSDEWWDEWRCHWADAASIDV